MNSNSLIFRGAVQAVALIAMPLIAFAQDARPIEWVVWGYAADGGSDIVARVVA